MSTAFELLAEDTGFTNEVQSQPQVECQDIGDFYHCFCGSQVSPSNLVDKVVMRSEFIPE